MSVIAEIARAVVPAGVAGVVGFGAAWLLRRSSGRVHTPGDAVVPTAGEARFALPVAAVVFALAFGATYPIITNQLPTLVPRTTADWIPHIALVGLVMGVLARGVRLPALVRWGVRALVVAAIGLAIVWRFLPRQPAGESLGLLALFTGGTLTAWAALEGVTDRTRGVSAPLLILGWLGCASQVVIFSGSESLGRSLACVAAAALPAVIIAFIKRDFTLAFGGAHVPVLAVGSVLLMLHQTADVPDLGVLAALLWLVPVTAWSVDEPSGVESRGGLRTVVRIGLAAVPGLIAVGLAISRVNLSEY